MKRGGEISPAGRPRHLIDRIVLAGLLYGKRCRLKRRFIPVIDLRRVISGPEFIRMINVWIGVPISAPLTENPCPCAINIVSC